MKRDHNVYILGAGFSREAGLPLMTDFLHRIREKFENPNANLKEHLQDDYEVVLDYRNSLRGCRDYIDADLDNIETLFSLIAIDCISEHTDNKNKLRSIRRVIADIVSSENSEPSSSYCSVSSTGLDSKTFNLLLKASLMFPSPRWKSDERNEAHVDAYTFFTAMLGNLTTVNSAHNNTVITFNYDTIIEDRAAALEIPISYGLTENNEPSTIKILKLHGSINWSQNPENGAPLIIPNESLNEDPLILPPTWQKNPEKWLQKTWSEALQAISEATNIIIIGYSMPETDSYFKHLITSGLTKNRGIHKLIVIDKSPSVIERYKKLFSPLSAYQKLHSSASGMSDSIYYLTGQNNDLSANRPLKIKFTRN